MEKFKTITKVIYNIIFVLLLVSASFILLTTYNVIPGFNFYVVMSGSMEPEIHIGSVVGIKEQEEYKEDDVVTVQMPYAQNETYTHRIIEVREPEESNEDTTFITKGDANETADGDPVSQDQILGKVFVSIPLIGYLVSFAKKPMGFIILVILPTVIIAASEINSIKEEGKKIMDSRREKKKEDSKNEIITKDTKEKEKTIKKKDVEKTKTNKEKKSKTTKKKPAKEIKSKKKKK